MSGDTPFTRIGSGTGMRFWIHLHFSELHVWYVELEELPEHEIQRLYHAVLDSGERIRADRFHFPVDRSRWIVAHAALRQVLARYTGSEAGAVRFGANEYGKPCLEPIHGPSSPSFNLSHSRGQALIAVARDAVGIDLEYIDPDLVWQPLAREICSEQEHAALMSLPEFERRQGFFRLWTGKEAFLKARGLGLNLPLKAFSIPVAATPIGLSVAVDVDWSDGRRWYVHSLAAAADFQASLTSGRQVPRIRSFRFETCA